ncbi:MAG: phage integrase SAM-like domain-containing protein [Candidatus Omnitrophica bacterium]|nr:phage integrase SAM-like domain-containing protein [Candidatus Omnitrophota bacterium]
MSYISSEGVHKRETTKCKSRTDAQAEYHRRKVEVAEGKEKQKSKLMRFEDFADKYLEKYSMVENRAWKKSDYVYINSLKKYFSGYPLSKITHDAILGFRAKKKKEGTKEGGINRILACLKSMFNRAIEWGDFNGFIRTKGEGFAIRH